MWAWNMKPCLTLGGLYFNAGIKGLIEFGSLCLLLDVMPKEFKDTAGAAPIAKALSFRTLL
jgi:hypothetical protein